MIADGRCFALAGALALAVSALGAAPASAADLPVLDQAFRGAPIASAGPGMLGPALAGPAFAEPVFAAPARFDANGYAYYGPTLPYPPSPLYASTGCPLAFQPVYDASGNFAGYGGIRLCRQ